ncbi:MAG: endonuclease/exonuclease/phosphatase family protein [Bacteroidota bacterium]
MRRIFRRIVFFLYLFTVIPLCGAILSQWISPATAWPFAFFGLAFPVLALLQVVFLLVFIILRSKAALFPALVIVTIWTPLILTFQLPGSSGKQETAAGQIKVTSYNVRLFDLFGWSKQKDASAGIFKYISDNKPDILCLQEFLIQDPGKFPLSRIRSQFGFLPHEYIEFNSTAQNRKHGLAIFSRYPIISSGHEHFPDSRNMFIYTDIKIGNDTIRVYNNHLESIHFERDEFQWIDDQTDDKRIPGDKISEIVHRMKSAYINRAGQSLIVKKHIRQSPFKVIVCGDFNDTPVSFTTNKIRNGLYDSFRSGGKGTGITYPNMKAPLRIDYILHSKEMVSSGFTIGKVKFSDHRPVSCIIKID